MRLHSNRNTFDLFFPIVFQFFLYFKVKYDKIKLLLPVHKSAHTFCAKFFTMMQLKMDNPIHKKTLLPAHTMHTIF